MQTLNNVPAGDAGYALASLWSGGRVVGQWDLWDVQKDIEGSMLLTSHHVCIVSIQLYVLIIFNYVQHLTIETHRNAHLCELQ